MLRCKASTSERAGFLFGGRRSERGENLADERLAPVSKKVKAEGGV